jgi:hypothetical protein
MRDEKTWDQRIFELVDWGVDESLIEANLRRSPTERIENMRAALVSSSLSFASASAS